LAALWLPILGAAQAAGLGNLVLLSYLGEPFRAEIDLLSYGNGETAVTPRLASPDTYQLADFRHSPALAGSRVVIRQHPNGRNYIEVTSSRPVNEPFVYLLIELAWNGTRVMRGYTVLIDPPGFGPPVAAAPAWMPEALSAGLVPGAGRRRASSAAAAGSRPAAARLVPRDPQQDITAVAGSTPGLATRIQVLEEQSKASAKMLAGLLERIAVLEQTAQRLQRELEMQNARAAAAPKPVAEPPARSALAPTPAPTPDAVVAAPPPAAPVDLPKEPPPAVAPAPPPVAQAPPGPPAVADAPASRPALSRSGSMVNEALLALVGGSLILVGWLVYLLSRRPRQGVTSEDILTKLLARDPQRDDVQLKLLEIYAARGDKTAYQNLAGKFHQLTGGQGEAWHKVASTGYELDPGNPLYAAGKYLNIMAAANHDANQLRH